MIESSSKGATLDLESMTLSEKMKIMEDLWEIFGRSLGDLWENLRRSHPDLPSPGTHGEILQERRQLIESGEARFTGWETAKEEIRTRCHENRNP